MKVSSLRVMTTRYLPDFSSRSRKARPNASTRFFSISSPERVPLSTPPWPGSITTTGRESGGAAGFGGDCGLWRDGGHRFRDRGLQLGPAVRQRLQEGRPIDLFQLDHQPRRLIVGGIEHGGVGDPCRPGQVEHHAGAARHHHAVAKCLDQPTPVAARPGREAKIDLGNVDHHPVGIIQRKGAKLDGLVEVEDKAGQLGVAGEPGIGGDREARAVAWPCGWA